MTAISQQLPAVGSPAPEFALPATSGSLLALSSFRGAKHVLLAFFPLAFTGTCTAELCAFTNDWDAFTSRDVEVLPISVDSVATLKEFRQKHGMTATLLSDFKRTVSPLYGVLNDEKFYSNRAYFLVDKAGILRWAYIEEQNGKRRENSEILEQIAALG